MLLVDASYAATVYSPELPWRSGLRIDVLATVVRGRDAWLYAGLGYGFDPPVTTSLSDVTLTTSRHAVTAVAGVARSVGPWRIAAELGPVVAGTFRSDQSTSASFRATGDHALWSVGACARARAALVLGGRSHLDAILGVSAYPAGEAYVVQSGGETSVFAPYRVQPEAALGLGYDLW
jgi:hypothetical protein